MEDNQEEYLSLDHEYCCDLLSTIEVKENRKRAATQINRLATSMAASNYDIDESVRVPHKKRVRTGFTPSQKTQGGKMPKHNGIQLYCALCKKEVIYHQNYMLHSSKNCFGKCFDQHPIKEGMEEALDVRVNTVKKYKKFEQKWNK